MRFFYFLLVCISTLNALDIAISSSIIPNGKTALFEFKKEKNIHYNNVVVDNKRYTILQHPVDAHKMYVLLPISYYEKPNDKKVTLNYKDKNVEKNTMFFLRVEDAKYAKETLQVDNSKVSLDKKDKKRASLEYKEAMDIYNTSTQKSYISSKFILPLDTKITSEFGKARVYNDTLKGYHSGTDFRAKVGVPIKASNDGVVVLAKDRFYSGGSIVIDHGHGIYTCYFHMSKFDVEKGQRVKKAQTIGLSGDSGRVTGPHLHFSARVSGVQVDPLQLITLMNKNLFKGIE